MYCSQCGTPNPDTDRFCRSCGTPLGQAPPAKAPPPQAAPPPPPAQPAYTPPPAYQAPPPPPPPPPPPVYAPPPAYAAPPPYQAPPPQAPYGAPPAYGAPPPYGQPPMAAVGQNKALAAIAYLLFGIGPLIGILMGGNDKFTKFHAWQAGLYDGVVVVLYILGLILSFVSGLFWFLVWILVVGLGVFALIAFIQVFSGKMYKIPLIGGFADNFSGR